MADVTVREFRDRCGAVVDRVVAGEHITITRNGEPVARIDPIRRRGLSAAELLERRQHLPSVDAGLLRTDIDDALEPAL